MTIIPAVDIKDGKVVRLLRGDFKKETVYSNDALGLARGFADAGAKRLHIVDLEGARTGEPAEKGLIRKLIVNLLGVKVQIGGGIRDPKTIEHYLGDGAWRVVVGTKACLDKGFLKEILGTFKEKIMVAVDAVDGKVATDGWTRISDMTTDTLIDRVLSSGGREIIVTDISKDGTLEGPNIGSIQRILGRFELGVVASGGISKLEDIKALADLKSPKLIGVITGKALYEKRFTLKEALALC